MIIILIIVIIIMILMILMMKLRLFLLEWLQVTMLIILKIDILRFVHLKKKTMLLIIIKIAVINKINILLNWLLNNKVEEIKMELVHLLFWVNQKWVLNLLQLLFLMNLICTRKNLIKMNNHRKYLVQIINYWLQKILILYRKILNK